MSMEREVKNKQRIGRKMMSWRKHLGQRCEITNAANLIRWAQNRDECDIWSPEEEVVIPFNLLRLVSNLDLSIAGYRTLSYISMLLCLALHHFSAIALTSSIDLLWSADTSFTSSQAPLYYIYGPSNYVLPPPF